MKSEIPHNPFNERPRVTRKPLPPFKSESYGGRLVGGAISLPDTDPTVLFSSLVIRAEDDGSEYSREIPPWNHLLRNKVLPYDVVVVQGVLDFSIAPDKPDAHPSIRIVERTLLSRPMVGPTSEVLKEAKEIYDAEQVAAKRKST